MAKNNQLLTLHEKQQIMLEILKEIDKCCRKYDLRYSLSDGTMLGAIRHKGFIPWDDDADIIMPRKDFEKFLSVFPRERFHLLYNTRELEEYLVYGYAKVIDPHTRVYDRYSKSRYGVFVDVFPVDFVPEKLKLRKKYIAKVRHIHNILHHLNKTSLFSRLKTATRNLDEVWLEFNEAIRTEEYQNSSLMACLVNCDGKTLLNKHAFDDLTNVQFEGHSFLGLNNPHGYLTMLYGNDYMTPKRWDHKLKIYRK